MMFKQCICAVIVTQMVGAGFTGVVDRMNSLPPEPEWLSKAKVDWLIDGDPFEAGVYRGADAKEIVLSNGVM